MPNSSPGVPGGQPALTCLGIWSSKGCHTSTCSGIRQSRGPRRSSRLDLTRDPTLGRPTCLDLPRDSISRRLSRLSLPGDLHSDQGTPGFHLPSPFSHPSADQARPGLASDIRKDGGSLRDEGWARGLQNASHGNIFCLRLQIPGPGSHRLRSPD